MLDNAQLVMQKKVELDYQGRKITFTDLCICYKGNNYGSRHFGYLYPFEVIDYMKELMRRIDKEKK